MSAQQALLADKFVEIGSQPVQVVFLGQVVGKLGVGLGSRRTTPEPGRTSPPVAAARQRATGDVLRRTTGRSGSGNALGVVLERVKVRRWRTS